MIIIIIQWVNYSVFRLFLFFVFVFLRSFFVFVNQIWVGGFPPIVFLILFLFFFIFKNKSENEIKIGKDRSCFPRVHSFLLSSSFFSLFCFSFPFVFVIPSIHMSKSNTRVSNNAFNKLRCYFRNPKYKITSIDSIARYQEKFVSQPYTTNKTKRAKKRKTKGNWLILIQVPQVFDSWLFKFVFAYFIYLNIKTVNERFELFELK